MPPTGSVLDSLLYHERAASDETIVGRVGSAKEAGRIILWITFQIIIPSSECNTFNLIASRPVVMMFVDRGISFISIILI